jgi:hypothetical protein
MACKRAVEGKRPCVGGSVRAAKKRARFTRPAQHVRVRADVYQYGHTIGTAIVGVEELLAELGDDGGTRRIIGPAGIEQRRERVGKKRVVEVKVGDGLSGGSGEQIAPGADILAVLAFGMVESGKGWLSGGGAVGEIGQSCGRGDAGLCRRGTGAGGSGRLGRRLRIYWLHWEGVVGRRHRVSRVSAWIGMRRRWWVRPGVAGREGRRCLRDDVGTDQLLELGCAMSDQAAISACGRTDLVLEDVDLSRSRP